MHIGTIAQNGKTGNCLTMLELLKKTYNGKKVFLTGHTGFKGSWLLVMLNELGADVMGFSLKPETENIG